MKKHHPRLIACYTTRRRRAADKKRSEKPFHFAGGIEFAKNASAKLARKRAASIFSGAAKTDSPVMYTAIVGINVYPSSRNFKLFFVRSQVCRTDAQGGEAWRI